MSTDWGGQLAKTIAPLAQLKVVAAQRALSDIRAMLSFGKFDFVTVDGVTLTARKTHFKLVSPGGTKLANEEFITLATIDPLINNYRGIHRTLGNPKMFRHTIYTGGDTTDGLSTAAECPLGGPIAFGPPFSNFTFDPFNISHNIAKTGRNSLAAMVIHEATHAIDGRSGFTESENLTTHISETEPPYETQAARFARHNPSAYATFAAHIHDKADRPRTQRFGLGGALNPNGGRPL
ncbi:MAG: hypothetical protein SGI77_27260 [Pirellulaceae bacterium]|nr:hypothetical protein [Pirellulaceae bacterium]